jgi:A/G-specific adenine glycosylase
MAPNFVSALLSWYDGNGRDLPWRDHPEAYAILVSEIMLQQTTVPAVIPYFKRWMENYSTVEDLAKADLEEVLLQWEGLGYYSRARNLHAAARKIVSEHRGAIPDDPVTLKELPGIGDYTAAAIASIAFGIRAPALDANNLRVWSRLLASSDKKRIARVFARVLSPDRPGDFNQALMDLGSSVCTAKNPDCLVCPLILWCRAYRKGKVSEYPEKKTRPDTTHIEAAIGIVVRDGKILVQRRPDTGLMAGLWEFPGGKIGKPSGGGKTGRGRGGETTSEAPEEAVVREVREETGLRVQVCEKLGVFNHAYTRFRVKLHVFICKRKAGTVHNVSAKWVTLEELEGLAMPSVNRKIVRKLEERLERERG